MIWFPEFGFGAVVAFQDLADGFGEYSCFGFSRVWKLGCHHRKCVDILAGVGDE